MRDVGAAHGGSHMRALWKSLLNEEGISLNPHHTRTARANNPITATDATPAKMLLT
jgi:hypothetical protein